MKNIYKLLLILLFIGFSFIGLTCTQNVDESATDSSAINLIMQDFAFAMVDSIKSGWVTFRMDNRGEELHEFFMHRLPDDISFEEMHAQVVMPMDSLQRLLLEGEIDSSQHQKAVQQAYPQWISNLRPYGGGGHISPGKMAETTMKLDPGNYVMTCFINSPNGRRHLFQGMIKPVVVKEDSSNSAIPEPDVEVTNAGSDITMNGSFGTGKQTMALQVQESSEEDSVSYSTAFLIRLNESTDIEDLDNYFQKPHQFEVLGGTLGVPSGQKSFVSAELNPGNYVWIFPNEQAGKKLREFTVE